MSKPLTWTDSLGRQWSCAIRLSDARRLKETGADIFNPDGIKQLFADTLSTIEFLVELLRPQWTKQAITVEDMSDAIIDGDGTYIAATTALKHGIADFFQRVDHPALAMVIERAWTTAKALETQAMANVCGPHVDRLMGELLKASSEQFESNVEKAIVELGGTGVE